MARRRRKRETRPADQADYNACLSWQRIFVGTMMAERSLKLVVAGFLQDTRALVDLAPQRTVEYAKERLRKAWTHVLDDNLWFAIVCALDARALAEDDFRPDRKAEEGRAFCEALRIFYPKAPPGFGRCGHSATGND